MLWVLSLSVLYTGTSVHQLTGWKTIQLYQIYLNQLFIMHDHKHDKEMLDLSQTRYFFQGFQDCYMREELYVVINLSLGK